MKSKNFLPVTLILFLITPYAAQMIQKGKAKSGIVSLLIPLLTFEGKVLNDEQPALVYLKGKGINREMEYKGKGEYKLSVPQGIYHVDLRSVRRVPDLRGVPLDDQRANFFVAANKVTRLRILPVGVAEYCDEKLGFALISSHQSFDEGDSSPIYERFLIRKPFDLVVKYCKKYSAGQRINYKFAQLSYKKLAVYADIINLDKNKLSVEAIGSKDSPAQIVMEDCIVEVDKIALDLNKLNSLCKKSKTNHF